MSVGRVLLAGVGVCGLIACANSQSDTSPDEGVHSFSQLGRPAVRAAATDRPAETPGESSQDTPWGRLTAASSTIKATPSAGTPSGLSLQDARRRVTALLAAKGFQPEDVSGQPGDRDQMLSATRMTVAGEPLTEATCPLKALNRPQMYAATISIHWAPLLAGVGGAVDARFEEVDKNLLSGDLTKVRCASRGRLEAEVRRAATGG